MDGTADAILVMAMFSERVKPELSGCRREIDRNSPTTKAVSFAATRIQKRMALVFHGR